MILLGLDIATTTGWAYFDPEKPISAILPGSFKTSGDSPEKKDWLHAGHLIRLFRERGRPDFVVIEQPLRMAPITRKSQSFMGQNEEIRAQVGGLTAVISSNQLVGATVGLLRGYGIPFATVDSKVWRKNAYGFGTRKGWVSKDWKKHAKDQCAQMRIPVKNADQAEAVWIAFYGPKCQQYKWLLQQRSAA